MNPFSQQIVPTCPVCVNHESKERIASTPYWRCPKCNLGFQNPMPFKLYEAAEEKGDDGRSGGHAQDKSHLEAASDLARIFSHNWLNKIPTDKLKVLDIGAKYPWFAHEMRRYSGAEVYGIDGMDLDTPGADPIVNRYQEELKVPMLLLDFEVTAPQDILNATSDPNPFDAITLIHVFEHFYDPLLALKRLNRLMKPQGVLYIRMPDHEVSGSDQHMSERHYAIHPYFWCEKAFQELISRSTLFKLVETYPMGAGVRDYLLLPSG